MPVRFRPRAPQTSPKESILFRTFLFLLWNQHISCPQRSRPVHPIYAIWGHIWGQVSPNWGLWAAPNGAMADNARSRECLTCPSTSSAVERTSAPWICGQLASELPTSPTGLDYCIVFFKSSSIRNDEGPAEAALRAGQNVNQAAALAEFSSGARERTHKVACAIAERKKSGPKEISRRGGARR